MKISVPGLLNDLIDVELPSHISGVSVRLTPFDSISIELERIYSCRNGTRQTFRCAQRISIAQLKNYITTSMINSIIVNMASSLDNEGIVALAKKEGIAL